MLKVEKSPAIASSRAEIKMTSKITPRQKEALLVLAAYLDVHGHSPTYAELGIRLGCTPDNARYLIHVLAKLGYVRISNKNINIALTNAARAA